MLGMTDGELMLKWANIRKQRIHGKELKCDCGGYSEVMKIKGME